MHRDAQALFNLVPESGDITYDELYEKANQRQLKHFHDMRRDGILVVKREKVDDRLILRVSRPGVVTDAN